MKNVSSLNTDEHVVTVLQKISIHLSPEYKWHGTDIDTELHSGAIFRGFENREDNEEYVGYVLICDVSKDDDEPDMYDVSDENVFSVEQKLRDELSNQVQLIETYTPTLGTLTDGTTRLMSSFAKIIDADREALMTSVRIGVPGQKFICVTCYPSAGFENFEKSVQSTIESITIA